MLLLYKHKTVGITTILSGLIALASLAFGAIAVNYHFEAFDNPSLMLSLIGVNAEAGKWSMICDMFGYYLLLLPLIFFLHDWMENKTPWKKLITFCGLAYVLTGSIGASVLAVSWPPAIHLYPASSPADQQIIKANFEMINRVVDNGMWNLLETIFAGLWWLLPALLLFKKGYKMISVAGIITAIFCLLDALSVIIDNEPLHQAALNGYLYLSIIWTTWIGIIIYFKPPTDL